jgi:hypothetical protein
VGICCLKEIVIAPIEWYSGMVSSIFKGKIIITTLEPLQLIPCMQSNHIVPRRKLDDIPLHHPFITLKKIGSIRGDMTIAINSMTSTLI